MKYQVIRSPRHHRLFFDILYHSQSRLNFSNGLYTMKIGKWVYTFKVNIKVKKTSRHNRSLISSLKSSDSGSFTFGLAGGHLYILSILFFVDNLRWNNIFFVWKNNCLGHLLTFFIQVVKIQTFKQNVHFTSGSKWRHFKTPIFRT